MTRNTYALYLLEEGSDDPRAIEGGGGPSEKFQRYVNGTARRLAAYLTAYYNRYGDSLVVRAPWGIK